MKDGRVASLVSVAESLASDYAALPQVEAITVARSLSSGAVDADSDIDLYVYSREPLAVDQRTAIIPARNG